MWWLWQQQHSFRAKEYHGVKESGSKEAASLQDKLSFGGLWPELTVEQVMGTQNDLLCYTY